MRMVGDSDFEIIRSSLLAWLSDYERDFGTAGKPVAGSVDRGLYDAAIRVRIMAAPAKSPTVFDRPILRKDRTDDQRAGRPA